MDRVCNGNCMQSEFSVYEGAETASLKMKIAALEQEKITGEVKVKKLEGKVEWVLNILENLLDALSEKARSVEDRSMLRSLADTVKTVKECSFCLKGEKEHHEGSDVLTSPSTLTGVIPGAVNRESTYSADEFVHGSIRSHDEYYVPCSEEVSYLFQAIENRQNMV